MCNKERALLYAGPYPKLLQWSELKQTNLEA